jgi:hypothetical protein
VKRDLKATDVIAQACQDAFAAGHRDWKKIRAEIADKFASLDGYDRASVENQLKLMLTREPDEIHSVVKH